MNIEGQVVHVPLSGGFWGIEGNDGRKYRPVKGLAPDFQVAGLVVKAAVEPVQTFSIFMWGTDVELLSIERISNS